MKKTALFFAMILIPCMIMHAGNLIGNRNKKVVLVFMPQVDGAPLKLGSHQYVNAAGDTFYVDMLKFYISQVHISGADFTTVNDYHLIDASDSSTFKIVYNDVSVSSLQELLFTLGVDSAINVSGAMGGDLDPAKGMYWAWNSGYIMAKLEGRSQSCKTVHHFFEFHIGGYKAPNKTDRIILLKINKLIPDDAQTVTVYITADVSKWFNSPTLIHLAQTNEISVPGAKASMLADNYAHMFSISSIDIK